MLKVNRNPLWIIIPVAVGSGLFYFSNPAQGRIYLIPLAIAGLTLVLQTAIAVAKRVAPPPVPDYAVGDLLERIKLSLDDWILVEFEPSIPLNEARQRVGSQKYSQENRKAAFLTKAQLISPSMPRVAFFFSSERGYLLANREATIVIANKYGRWTIDTWNSLMGAARRFGFVSHSLDGPQFMHLPRD